MTTFSDSAERIAKQLEPITMNREWVDGYCDKHQKRYMKVISNGWVGCPTCYTEQLHKDNEIVVQQRAEKIERQKQLGRFYELSIMDEELEQASFDNFKTDTARQREVLKWAKSMARYYYEGGRGNVIMTGDAGRGKSHLAYSMIKALMDTQREARAAIVNVVDLLDEIKSDFEQKQFWMKSLAKLDYLVLDDLGAEKVSDWSKEVIYSILNKRTRTIITTNLTAGELVDSYGKRIASRLLKGCPKEHIMDFAGLDDERMKLWT